jgi:hypothetical protein
MSIDFFSPWINCGVTQSPNYSPFSPFPNMLWKPGFPNEQLGKYFFWFDNAGNGSVLYNYKKIRQKYRCFKIIQSTETPTLLDITSRVCIYQEPSINGITVKLLSQFEIEFIDGPSVDPSNPDPENLSIPDYASDPSITYDLLTGPNALRIY